MTAPTWTNPPEDPVEYADRLTQLGLGQHAEALAAQALPSARLTPTTHPDPESARTRLGGRPLLAPDAPWPATDEGRPLSFIAHIDCAEASALLPNEPLPEDGLLGFFYDGVEQEAWGFDPTQSDHWAVTFAPAGTTVALRDFPDGLEGYGRYRPQALAGRVEWTFLPIESLTVDALNLANCWRDYGPVLGEPEGDELTHRFLGHPDPIQGDMQHECQLASRGVYTGDGKWVSDPRNHELLAGAEAWRLLLQIDSAEEIGMMWGDVGRLYWWMHPDALTAARWDEAWFVLQCG